MKGIDESLSSIFSGPQSPCERTDLRMAIVADHLGLSWTGENIQHCVFSLKLLAPNHLPLVLSALMPVIYCHLQANRIPYNEELMII